MEEGDNQWILGSPMTTSRIGSLNVSTVTSMVTWKKKCRAEKKERETWKCFKCDKTEYIAKNCKGKQTMKTRKVQEESNKEDKEEKGFGEDLE